MNEELKQLVQTNYKIPTVQKVLPITEGFLSNNFAIEASDQKKYFFKQYRYKEIQRVTGAHEAKFFFSSAGIPVILPLTLKSGGTILQHAGRFYCLFPFIKGYQPQRDRLPTKALESMAQMQGKIHQFGANAKLLNVRKNHAKRNQKAFIDIVHLILSKIPKENKTEFDECAEEGLHLKLDLVQQSHNTINEIQIASDHLVHGDYHNANLFFDQNHVVSHVFDWEKTKIASRTLNLIRTIEFVCFNKAGSYMPDHSEKNFDKARRYLAAYCDIYPVRPDDFLKAATARYLLDRTMSLWVETAHYLNENKRVDVFLKPENQVLKYYSHHFEDYVKRICTQIL